MRFLVVDDEDLSREYIKNLISEFMPNASVLVASSVVEAWDVCDKYPPTAVFLDIQMPDRNGFEFLERFIDRTFEVIFVTAYSQFTIKAIREGACDYILKPIRRTEFRECFDRLNIKLDQKKEGEVSRYGYSNDYLNNSLVINFRDSTRFIKLKDILYIKANNTYSTIVVENGERIVTSRPINSFEKTLRADFFYRIHRTYMINLEKLVISENRFGHKAIMANGDKLQVSRYKYADLLEKVKSRVSST